MIQDINLQLVSLQEKSNATVQKLESRQALEGLRQEVLGKKGYLTTILKGLKDIPPEQRSQIGSLANQIKTDLLEKIHQKDLQLKTQ